MVREPAAAVAGMEMVDEFPEEEADWEPERDDEDDIESGDGGDGQGEEQKPRLDDGITLLVGGRRRQVTNVTSNNLSPFSNTWLAASGNWKVETVTRLDSLPPCRKFSSLPIK